MFYTYLHTRNDTGRVFYVGKGRGVRAWSKNSRTNHWRNVVCKHGHQVKVIAEWPTEEEAYAHEVFLIACFKDLGHPLVNMTTGGEGRKGYRASEETRTKLSAALKGRPVPETTRRRASEVHKGKVVSEETRRKMSEALKGRVISPETRAKIRAAMSREGRRRGWTLTKRHTVESKALMSEKAKERATRHEGPCGRKLRASEWAEILGVTRQAINARVRRGMYPDGSRKE